MPESKPLRLTEIDFLPDDGLAELWFGGQSSAKPRTPYYDSGFKHLISGKREESASLLWTINLKSAARTAM